MSIVVAIIIFSLIIIIHEFGHFLLARKNGITVVEFSIGLGPTIVGFHKGGTKFSLKLFPIGGMCQMLGEDSDQQSTEEGSFYSKNVWQRISVIFAGPFFNFLLAFLLSLVIIGTIGYDPASIRAVASGSPAEEAGLQAGDVIIRFGKSSISIGRELDSYFFYHAIDETPIAVEYKRDGERRNTTIYPTLVERYLLGFQYYPAENAPAQVSAVTENYPMHLAGVLPDDVITGINGTPIASGAELSAYMDAHPLTADSVVSVTYERAGDSTTVEVTPVYHQSGYTTGITYNLGREKTSIWNTVRYSVVEVKYWIVTTVKNVGMLITGQLSSKDVGGPVAIVSQIGEAYEQTAEQGTAWDVVLQMVYITILLSANLGVMNLLPIPALDGGKLIFLLVEAVRGKPVNREKEGMVHLIGMIALMILMVVIFFNDIRNLF